MTKEFSPVRRAWVPALLWLMVIALESTPLLASDETGQFLLPILRFFVPQITKAQFALVHGALRKAGHFFGYGVLSLLMLRAWWAMLKLPRWAMRLPRLGQMMKSWSLRAAAMAVASTVLVAAFDEWNQAHIPGRTGTFQDVLLDSSAAVFVQLVVIAMSDVETMSPLAVGRWPLAGRRSKAKG